jgi:hypothetical protein
VGQLPIPVDEAARALTEVRSRQDQVITDAVVPSWFFAAIGGLMVGFFAAIESRRPLWVIAGSLGYSLGLGALIGYLTVTRRLQVRTSLIGVRGGLAIAAFTIVLVAIALGLAFGLDALGVGWPATIAGTVAAAGLAAGGPLLMRYLNAVMHGRHAAGAR